MTVIAMSGEASERSMFLALVSKARWPSSGRGLPSPSQRNSPSCRS